MTDYAKLGAEIGALVQAKQIAYGDSFSKSGAVMRIFYPNGISPRQMDNALTIVRVIDKIFRVASAPESGDPMGESPWRDICGYSQLATAREEEERALQAAEAKAKLLLCPEGVAHPVSECLTRHP